MSLAAILGIAAVISAVTNLLLLFYVLDIARVVRAAVKASVALPPPPIQFKEDEES